jgi:WhiB family transcriptional regulator, redox-sensing transcriptional regulator
MIGGMSRVVVQFRSRETDSAASPACAKYPAEWWFDPARFSTAVEICGRCSMRGHCLDQALRTGERLGVWGGLTPEQRAALPDAVVIPFRARSGVRR